MPYLAEIIPSHEVRERNFNIYTGPKVPDELLEKVENNLDAHMELWFSSMDENEEYNHWKLFQSGQLLYERKLILSTHEEKTKDYTMPFWRRIVQGL